MSRKSALWSAVRALKWPGVGRQSRSWSREQSSGKSAYPGRFWSTPRRRCDLLSLRHWEGGGARNERPSGRGLNRWLQRFVADERRAIESFRDDPRHLANRSCCSLSEQARRCLRSLRTRLGDPFRGCPRLLRLFFGEQRIPEPRFLLGWLVLFEPRYRLRLLLLGRFRGYGITGLGEEFLRA